MYKNLLFDIITKIFYKTPKELALILINSCIYEQNIIQNISKDDYNYILSFLETSLYEVIQSKNKINLFKLTIKINNFLSSEAITKNGIKLNDNIKKINNIKIKEKPYHYKLENPNCNVDCNNCNIDYNSNSNNKIITINMSFLDNNLLEKIFKLYQNIKIVIFLDPPWGGKEYKNYDKIVFGLDGISLKTIIHTIRKIKKDIDFCIKLPKNYFLESLNGIRYNIYKFKKFIVIYCY
jgi:hypothetical protein